MSYDDEAFWHRDDPNWNPKRGMIRLGLLFVVLIVAGTLLACVLPN